MVYWMNILNTPIEGLFVVESTPFIDHRGEFYRCFCEHKLKPVIGARHIVQINFSLTTTVGSARGLHFQHPPFAEMKLIRCLKGRVWDVAVDVRADSPTFLTWHAEELSSENTRMMVIPEGCAHGFQVLEAESELLYLHTAPYTADSEGALNISDPAIGIPWPLNITEISDRDKNNKLISNDFKGIAL
jgi:dTDP-4-dehydrorhamnose 3,5-epimerase